MLNTPRTTLRPASRADLPRLTQLLQEAGLSDLGVVEALDDFVVAESNGRVVGAVGVERYGSNALLRSAVVDPLVRGSGVGRLLVVQILSHAARRGSNCVYLLTTTAENWFPRFGFERVSRDEVPESVKTSVEFREICPASAVVMVKRLT